MPAKSKKEQQQIVMLGVVLALIGAVLLYSYGSRLIPQPLAGEAPPPEGKRIVIPPSAGNALYERADFKSLRQFGDVPVKPLRSGGSAEPFITELK